MKLGLGEKYELIYFPSNRSYRLIDFSNCDTEEECGIEIRCFSKDRLISILLDYIAEGKKHSIIKGS